LHGERDIAQLDDWAERVLTASALGDVFSDVR